MPPLLVKLCGHESDFHRRVVLMLQYIHINLWYTFSFSKIDPNTSKAMKIYPLPHMYVIKDLVPVSILMDL
jgi:succinate dehydrogenase/fumarate reductase-like Fe-S protein